MGNENTSFAYISIPFLRSCSQCCEHDHIIFHHSIQHDEASGNTFYNKQLLN